MSLHARAETLGPDVLTEAGSGVTPVNETPPPARLHARGVVTSNAKHTPGAAGWKYLRAKECVEQQEENIISVCCVTVRGETSENMKNGPVFSFSSFLFFKHVVFLLEFNHQVVKFKR